MTPEEAMSTDPEFVMYSKNGCVWCDRMVKLLVDRGVFFDEVKVDYSLENLEELRERLPGVKTVPQLFKGDVYVGGYEETVKYFKEIDDASAA